MRYDSDFISRRAEGKSLNPHYNHANYTLLVSFGLI